MPRLEACNEREDLVIPFLLQAASILPLLIHKSLGASVGRQLVGGSEVEAAASIFYYLCEQQHAAEQAPSHKQRSALPTAGFESLLIIAKGEPMETGKFSPQQQPEGPTIYELDLASGEQTGSLDPRVQTSCVSQPWCI